MPAKATLFNLKCEAMFDFGTGPRNICQYNPQGNNILFKSSKLLSYYNRVDLGLYRPSFVALMYLSVQFLGETARGCHAQRSI